MWLSVWDSQVDAAEFGSDVEAVLARRFPRATVREGSVGKQYAVGGRTITVWGGEVAGRPAVLYEDLPDGVGPSIIDRRKVVLREE